MRRGATAPTGYSDSQLAVAHPQASMIHNAVTAMVCVQARPVMISRAISRSVPFLNVPQAHVVKLDPHDLDLVALLQDHMVKRPRSAREPGCSRAPRRAYRLGLASCPGAAWTSSVRSLRGPELGGKYQGIEASYRWRGGSTMRFCRHIGFITTPSIAERSPARSCPVGTIGHAPVSR